jgi:O-acetyl-ADP-ribose deacetylase (regulator of RNase III)
MKRVFRASFSPVLRSSGTRVIIKVLKGISIVDLDEPVDAIVNCANGSLSGSTNLSSYWRFAGRKNVDTAIQDKAGPELLQACLRLPVVKPPHTRCLVGSAVISESYGALSSQCKWVIHCVGPRNADCVVPHELQQVLTETYLSCLIRGQEKRIKSIAFPAISCGVGEVSPAVSAKAFWDAVCRSCGESNHSVVESRPVSDEDDDITMSQSPLDLVIVCCLYESKTYAAWIKQLEGVAGASGS